MLTTDRNALQNMRCTGVMQRHAAPKDKISKSFEALCNCGFERHIPDLHDICPAIGIFSRVLRLGTCCNFQEL